ncbi:LD-carboxypeptidase LdcB/DacB [Streptococcus infantis]|uniref:LD-carboxypeptidase LdcB/DacB n=1 Tax=Streptococcus infantis TaxID=68892 RepID=UPI0039C267AD
MKKRYLVLSGLLALTLAACSQEKPATSETQTSTEEKTVQEGTVGSKSHEASQKKAEVVNKGDYYSVQGKYDEIVIANKHYPLSKDYNPGENPTAKAELLKLIAAMQEAGFPISDHYSGFRSYETQTQLYQDYVNKDGKAEADRYSARPGYSEHQTGLAFDLIGTDGDLVTEEKAAQWLLDHAADYGFVVRYLKGKEKETGYMAEEWHLRYVGKEAKDIAASGLSLEEYYGFEGGDYVD